MFQIDRTKYTQHTITNTETGVTLTQWDDVTVGKSKNVWQIEEVLNQGWVRLHRQNAGTVTYRKYHMDNLTKVETEEVEVTEVTPAAEEAPKVAPATQTPEELPAIGARVYVHSRDPKGKGDTTGTVMRYISGPDRPGVTLVIHFDKQAGDGIAFNYPEQCTVLGGLDSADADTQIRVHNNGTYRKTATNEWVRIGKTATTLTNTEMLDLMLKESI